MQLIRQSTVTTIYVGPVLDSTGAAVTTAVLGDFRIVKNGTAATLTGATVTHDANGYYTIALTTGNTDTTGRLTLAVGNTAQSMSTHRYSVLLPSVFDALITNATNATGGLPTATGAITALAGTIATSTNITAATGVVLSGVTHTGAVIPTVSDVTTKTGYSLLATTGLGNQTANITGNLSGSVGSVTGAVGSVTGNVGGNVVGSVASVTNAIVLPNIPTNWITAAGIASAALNGKGDWNIGKTGFSLLATTGLGNQTANITGNLSGSVGSVTGAVGSVTGSVGSVASGIPTAAAIAAQVWSETIPGSYTSGQAGGKLNSAGAAGDPWNTALPGSYAAGTAGYIVGVSLPRYGDTQRWTSPTNTLDVTISKV